MLGIVFSIMAAAAFGMTATTTRRGVVHGSASQGLYITIFTGAPLFVVAALVTGQAFRWEEITGIDYVLLIAGGISQILIGRYSYFRTVAAMGTNRATPVLGLATLVSIGVAVVFLDEVLTPLMVLGIALIMLGPTIAVRRRARTEAPAAVGETVRVGTGSAPPAERAGTGVASDPRLVEGYTFGLIGAASWGLAPVLMRAGLDESGLSVLGGMVAYLVVAALMAATLALPGRIGELRNLDRGSSKWFVFTAVESYAANVLRFAALGLAPVTLVVPLMRTQAVFALIFNFAFNRSLESFEPRVIAGIFVSFLGAALLVL